MGKVDKPDISPKQEPMPPTGCVVCGQYTGTLSTPLGHPGGPRWHAECEASRPDVIAKAKARA